MTATTPPLTAERVRQMPAGRELDMWVATLVLGLPAVELRDARCPECHAEMRFCGQRSYCSDCMGWRYSPYREYSNEIAPAWQVVQKFAPYVKVDARGDGAGNWGCTIWTAWGEVTEHGCDAPEAVCRAAVVAAIKIAEAP